jgi:hypothetical protein
MKNHKIRGSKIALIFLMIVGFSYSGISFAGSCSGKGASSCSGVGATSSTCATYYLNNGKNSIQCKWNSSNYCSDGGAPCQAPS